MSENFDNIISLTDENGVDTDFEVLDLIEYNGKEYVILLPTDDDDAGEVVILEVVDEGDDMESFVSVDDESVLMAVFEQFKEAAGDEFDFTEEN